MTKEPNSAAAGVSRTALVALVLVAVVVGFAGYASLGVRHHSCRGCVSFRGSVKCRSAAAEERASAIRVATENACSFLTESRAERLQCAGREPLSVECVDHELIEER